MNFNLPAQCHSVCLRNKVKDLKLFYRINTRRCNVIKEKCSQGFKYHLPLKIYQKYNSDITKGFSLHASSVNESLALATEFYSEIMRPMCLNNRRGTSVSRTGKCASTTFTCTSQSPSCGIYLLTEVDMLS